MKKLFTLIAVTLVAIAASAQTYTFSGLTNDKFAYDESDFTYGTTSDLMFDYVKQDKVNYSELSLKDTPISFLYKNSGSKTKFFQLNEKNFVANGKGSQIKFNGLTVGSTVKLSIGSKGSTASTFTIVEGFEGDIPTFEVKDEDYVYQTITLKATASTAILSETAGGYALESIEITGASEGGDTPSTDTPVYTATINNDPTYAFARSFTAQFIEYSDRVVIKGFDGKEGDDLVLTWDDNGWNAINGEAAPWVYLSDTNYYGAYLYTGKYTYGAWDEKGGYFAIGGYFYKDLNDAGTWLYIYYTWDNDPASITSTIVKADAALFDLQGRKLNAAPAKGMYIQNGKKYMAK